jgi:hypothetical protein
MDDGFKNIDPDFGIHGLEIGVVDKFFWAFLIDLGVINVMNEFRDIFDDDKNEHECRIKSVRGLKTN